MIHIFASKAPWTKVSECCCTSHQPKGEIGLPLWDDTCLRQLLIVTAHHVCPVAGSQVSKKSTWTRRDNDPKNTFYRGRQQKWQQRSTWWCLGALKPARRTACLSRSDLPPPPAERCTHSECFRCLAGSQHDITSDTLVYRWLGAALLQLDRDDVSAVSSREKVTLTVLPMLSSSQKKFSKRCKSASFEMDRIHLNDHGGIGAFHVDSRGAIDLRVSGSFYSVTFISGRFVFPPVGIDHTSLFERSNGFCLTEEKKEQLQIRKVTPNQHCDIFLLGARRLFFVNRGSALATLLLHSWMSQMDQIKWRLQLKIIVDLIRQRCVNTWVTHHN